jgi:hypothetical protein
MSKATQRPTHKTIAGEINVLIRHNSNLSGLGAWTLEAWIKVGDRSYDLDPYQYLEPANGSYFFRDSVPSHAKTWRGEQYNGRQVTLQKYWEGKAQIPV